MVHATVSVTVGITVSMGHTCDILLVYMAHVVQSIPQYDLVLKLQPFSVLCSVLHKELTSKHEGDLPVASGRVWPPLGLTLLLPEAVPRTLSLGDLRDVS